MSKKKDFEHRKLKQTIDAESLKGILKNWLQALEQNKDFSFQAKGEGVTIPTQALTTGRLQLEFESKKGEFELELKLKWKESPEKREPTEGAGEEVPKSRKVSSF